MLPDQYKRLGEVAKALGFSHDDGVYVQRVAGSDLLVVSYKHGAAYGCRWFKPPPSDITLKQLHGKLATLRAEIINEIAAGRRGKINIGTRVSMDMHDGICARTGEVHGIDLDRNEVTIKLTDGTPDRKTEDSC